MNDTIKKMKKENLRLTRVHAHTQACMHTHTHTHTHGKAFVSRKYSSPKILQMNTEKTDNTIFKLGKNPEQVLHKREPQNSQHTTEKIFGIITHEGNAN